MIIIFYNMTVYVNIILTNDQNIIMFYYIFTCLMKVPTA